MQHEIHISDVRTYKACRRKWDFTSPLRQAYVPDEPYAPFFVGRIVHEALDLYYGQGMPFQTAVTTAVDKEYEVVKASATVWDQEVAMLLEHEIMARGLLRHYEWWVKGPKHDKHPLADKHYEWLATEMPWTAPLRTHKGVPSSRVFLGGRYDGVVRDKRTKKLWLWETKTAARTDSLLGSLVNDEQASEYIMVAEDVLGEKVEGLIYNIIRKKVPPTPKILKSGFLSEAKSADVSFDWFARQAMIHHQKEYTWKDIQRIYAEYLAHLLNEADKYFIRVVVKRTPEQLEAFRNSIHQCALEMSRTTTPIYPSPSAMTCNWCRFKGPCAALDRGDKAFASVLLQTSYRTRAQEQENENDEEDST